MWFTILFSFFFSYLLRVAKWVWLIVRPNELPWGTRSDEKLQQHNSQRKYQPNHVYFERGKWRSFIANLICYDIINFCRTFIRYFRVCMILYLYVFVFPCISCFSFITLRRGCFVATIVCSDGQMIPSSSGFNSCSNIFSKSPWTFLVRLSKWNL